MAKTANQKLEAARLKKRWSIGMTSKKIGVSVNTFNRWERGLQRPQPGKLDQLCQAFAMSPQELGFEPTLTPNEYVTTTVQEQTPVVGLSAGLPTTPACGEATDPLPQTQQPDNTSCLYVEPAKKNLATLYQALDDGDA